ncbi:MAG: hypothetical protein U9R56_03665, partial [candidate division Zixibacteria bacterium]|nr:hypothetical protein [candidate division Zixibacteria bacterium]
SRSTYIVVGMVIVLFVLSWVFKAFSLAGEVDNNIVSAFLVTISAFLTLAIFSFLYKDNPFYKFAEHLFVGVSAAFWMSQAFWSTIVGNLLPRLSEGISIFFMVPYQPSVWNITYWIPVIFGVLLLMRLSDNYGWLSRWPLAFIVGTTAGLNFVRYLRSDFIVQISSTFVPLLGREPHQWQGVGHFFSNLDVSATGQFAAMISSWVIFLGVFCGIIYFFFSKEHTGMFGRASRVGIWILMITFGASFGYTVMGRISLLVGRITFLFRDWLGIID